MQERMAYAGQSDVYNESNDLINKFLRIEVTAMQVYRVTDKWGEQSVDIVNENEASALKINKNDVVYVELDGAMVLTREEKWQEVKTGRIFRQSDLMTVNEHRKELKSSLYTSNLGDYEAFLEKFEPLVNVFDKLDERLVILSDGAKWIRNWGKDNYPKATHILDYYHVCEHLSEWLKLFSKSEQESKNILEEWKKVLLEQGVAPVIKELKAQQTQKKKLIQEKEKLLNYLKNNAYRMEYHLYKQRNLQIGSGAIESAQRTVLQKRMKRSGQRWTQDGVQHMLNLRVGFLSDKWQKIVNTNSKRAA